MGYLERAALAGIATGMRSMSAIAALILTEAPARYSDHPNNERCDMTAKIARPTTARIRPLPPEDRDPESKALIDSIGSSSTDNTFNTLARHPSLLRAWMPFAAGILVEGQLPARVRELAILRTGWNCRSEYEFGQHAVLARKVGVSDEDIVRVQSGPNAEGWTELESATLRAADELHADACITDETWATLAEHLDDRQLIEVPVLVGQYHLVAYMLNSLGIELEPGLAFPTVPPNTWR
jgi:alkylhydroperoxidase family enzyme